MGSKPNKLHIILKIFGFLVFSIGILYICQFFSKSLLEGFVSLLPRCVEVTESGRKILLCSTIQEAKTIFLDMKTTLPNKYDNVCVESEADPMYFTCYTRPAQPVYNDVYGVYRDFDPILDRDTMPEDLAPSIGAFCTSYGANTIKIIKNLSSIKTVSDNVAKTTRNLDGYINSLKDLAYTKCNMAGGATTFPAGMEDECTSMITTYQTISNIKNTSGISAASTMVSYSMSTLSNMSTQIYSVYNGSKCDTAPGYALLNR